jgi:hypothetical protein
MQSPQGRAPFQAAGPHQARPMAGQAISVGTPKESRVRAAADVDRYVRYLSPLSCCILMICAEKPERLPRCFAIC